MKISVVVPVFNEASTIKEVVRRILNAPIAFPVEVVIVDDGSTDGTVDFLRNPPISDDPRVQVLFHAQNRGKGAAVRTGLQATRGDIVIIQDADLEYSPKDYPILLEPFIEGVADVVYGSRFLGQKHRVLYFWHMVGNTVVTLISNMLTNINLTDMMTGYKAFRADIVRRIPLRSKGFGFEPEVTAKVARLGCRIYEVAVSYEGRTFAEGKKIRWRTVFSIIYTCVKYWLVADCGEKLSPVSIDKPQGGKQF